MKTKTSMHLMLVMFLLGSISIDTAMAQKRSGMQKNKMMYSRNYNVNTVETIEGEITEVVYQTSKKQPGMEGVHLVVKTASETVPVHLGPAWYMNQQEFTFSKGDNIVVTGSRITFINAPALVAANLKRGDMLLQLRDQNGFPRWRGWRMNSAMNN